MVSMDPGTQTASLVLGSANCPDRAPVRSAPPGHVATPATHRDRSLRPRPRRPDCTERCCLQHVVERLDSICVVSSPYRGGEEEPDRPARTLAVDAHPHATGAGHTRVPYLLPP